MDGVLPSYEAAMREAREYLRRRDLTSQDEIPLYFAWERLYAAANANLSTDFLNETRAELRARQQARLAPRQGLPPPLFTSFDKLNRKSMHSSAFLRSGLSSDAAIEMMARRYRHEAEKLRASREKLTTGSRTGVGNRVKKSKFGTSLGRKTPREEVNALLEDLDHLSEPENKSLVGVRSAGGKMGITSNDGEKRNKKTNRRRPDPEREVEELLAKFEQSNNSPASKVQASPKANSKGILSRIGKDQFVDELAGDIKPAKLAELRSSSFSKGNAINDPVETNLDNVAVYAAQVADWNMKSVAGTVDLPKKLVENVLTSTAKGTNRANGANKLRKTDGVEGGEADTTFDTALGSSGSEEDNLNRNRSLRSSAVSTSPTSRRSTAHTSEWVDSDQENVEVGKELPMGSSATNAVLQDQSTIGAPNPNSVNARPTKDDTVVLNPVQVSHAVGGMQVKIHGKEIELTFKGSLDDADSDEVSNTAQVSCGVQPPIAKMPTATQKVFRTAGINDDNVDEQRLSGQRAQKSHTAKGDANVPRKQSSVRFSEVGGDNMNEDPPNEDKIRDDRGESQNEFKMEKEHGSLLKNGPPSEKDASRKDRSVSSRNSENDLSYDGIVSKNAIELMGGGGCERNSSSKLRKQQPGHEKVHENGNESGDSQSSTSQVEAVSRTGSEHVAFTNQSPENRLPATKAHRNEVSSRRTDEKTRSPASANNTQPKMFDERAHRIRSTSSSRVSQNTAIEGSVCDATYSEDGIEVENAKDLRSSNKTHIQQTASEIAERSRDYDKGALRSNSYSRVELRDSNSDDKNEVLTNGMLERHRSTMRSDHRDEQTRSKKSNNRSTDKRSRMSSSNHVQTTSDEVNSEEEEFDSEGQISRQKRNTQPSHKRASRIDPKAKGHRQSSRTKQRSSSSEYRMAFSDYESEISSGDDRQRGNHKELNSRKRSDRPTDGNTKDKHRPVSQRNLEDMSDEWSDDRAPERRSRPTKRNFSTRRSRNEQILVDQTSDEDLFEGPDTSDSEYHHRGRRNDQTKQERRDPRKYANHGGNKRNSVSSRHPNTHYKQRNHSPNSNDDSSFSDHDSRGDVQKLDRRHDSHTAQYSQSSRLSSDRQSHRRRSKYATYDLIDQDPHLAVAMASPPKRSKPENRIKENKFSKTRNDPRPEEWTSRSRKFPEGIVWPPGMEAECIARLGLDGHHPIAPPGLEHLVTDEQWGDYWTWLHWYSSWQMWYMKNGKKPKRKCDKTSRSGGRRTASEESLDIKADRPPKSSAHNANWWVDVGPNKRRSRNT
ncbi:unnamed protein product [Phytophthora fragariaefolia]|uniref:Unnamed protein product n=1 Tax=Phytophthora fragariaefolia TaxID=1490495 RepID=A0A9W7D472_9STRA|nr:unnamed protein product [Phytophthora fragariaefolia]